MGFCVCLCVCETGSRAAELSPQGSPTLGQQSSTSEDIWVLRKPLAGKLKACFCGGKKEMMCVRHVVCVCNAAFYNVCLCVKVASAAAASAASAVFGHRAACRALETRMF